ncbi:MAG TPA: SHOCT domain-containing protein [Gemmatimonadaceae bacterium]
MPVTPSIPKDAATDRGVYDALEALRALLIPGEEIEAMAVQRRIFALTHRREAVAATTGRLIIVHRNLIAGYKPIDCRWQDVHQSGVTVGIFGATLTVAASHGNDLAMDQQGGARVLGLNGLRKDEAQEVYRVCQAREQAWREKRRVRELEEMRAKAGGFQFAGSGLGASATSSDANGEPAARLQRAKEMLKSGLLTDAEFEQIKAKILAEL